ncbi:glycosyltransferase family 2 protein [Alicyclobacillus sp. ALC3]|uniref:glycosyltransferase family 2 protein n=1 Tax=Alicyclobacillus sp. ALC3 TaxID=2796143 RepID=UPI002379AD5C|nr:glycosyltransferase family 2 protein [Alicyclobacillus sp. ALC3]WDL95163.1 glycosyltransferase family 2 protein [Alicyclobacillus sp. ALC3]
MKVSVILNSYNRPKLIRLAVESVQKQTYPHWELFIVDDNSNEDTKSVLADLAKNEPKCTVIQSNVKEEDRSKTTRYATCINMAIPQLTGDLVTYLTDDDIYYPDRFQQMVRVFVSNPDIYVVYGRQRLTGIDRGQTVELGIRSAVGVTRTPASHIDHCSVMHRKSCFNFVPRWNDDPLLWCAADSIFFTELAEYYAFYPVDFITDEHRQHFDGVQAKLGHGVNPWEGNFE